VNSAVTLRPPFVVDVVNVTVIPSEGGSVGELGELEVWVDIYGRVGVTPVPPSISSLAVKARWNRRTLLVRSFSVSYVVGIRTLGITHVSVTPNTIVFRDSNGHGHTFFARVRPASAIEPRSAWHVLVPPIPGFPTPGRDAPFSGVSELITMQAFGVSSSEQGIPLHTQATITRDFQYDLSRFPIRCLSSPNRALLFQSRTIRPRMGCSSRGKFRWLLDVGVNFSVCFFSFLLF
jgi:hypothetical protein